MQIKFNTVPKIYVNSIHTSVWYNIEHETSEYYIITTEDKMTCIVTKLNNDWQYTIASNLNSFAVSKERVFESGAKRDSNLNKPFIHNLKAYTRLRFGYHMTLGASKYGDSNWEKGMPTDQYLESIDRHLALYMEGDRSEDHLSAIMFGINGIMCNEKSEGITSDYYFKLCQPKMKAGETNV